MLRGSFFFVVFVATMGVFLWIPFRHGRRPLALYDQFSAVLLGGLSCALTVSQSGAGIWKLGLPAFAFGLCAYLGAEHLTMRFATGKSGYALALWYLGTFMAIILGTIAGAAIGSRLLGG